MKKCLHVVSLLVLLIVSRSSLAAVIPVNSMSALQTAINNAAPGDVIVVADGVYTLSANITIRKQGTAAQPILITAASIGGVEITGTGGFYIDRPSAYITITGFKFKHSAGKAALAQGTAFCKLTHNLYQTPGEGDNLNVQGNDHELAYNTFQDKAALGQYLSIHGSGNGGSQIAQRIWVHHNAFLRQRPGGGNGSETVQFGLSGYSLSSSNSIFEYNYFEQCDGENELISVKASRVILRYNTIRDCPAQFTLRHGNFCQVYGNYFLRTPGIRIYGDDHTIHSNHFEACSIAINIGNGDGEVADGSALTVHDRPDRILIAFNTLVNNTTNIRQAGRTNGLGSRYITGAYNIIQGSAAPAVQISGTSLDSVWIGNILHNIPAGGGNISDTGYVVLNPLLARDATGTFHLQAGSPAIGRATRAYPLVAVDMDGQPRTSALDAGADQFSSAPVIARLMDSTMAGYLAGGSAPVAAINMPLANALLEAGKLVTIAADAITLADTITHLDFYADGIKLGSDSSRPFSFDWLAIYGQHTLSVKAFDSQGQESAEARTVVTVNPAGTRVALTAPLAGAVFQAPVYIDLAATATDSLGTISYVEFFNGTVSLGMDSSAPYTYRWMAPAPGNYTLSAKTINNEGQQALSATVGIAVKSGSFDITDNGGLISGQYPNTSKPTENFPSLIDNNPATKYYRSGRTALWIQYQSTVPAIVVRYTLTSGNDRPARDPKDWSLLGSNNGTSWITLDTRVGQVFAGRGELKSFDVANNTTPYLYYRLDMTANNGEANTQLAEWELIERRIQTIQFDSIPDHRYGDDAVALQAESSTGLPIEYTLIAGPATLNGSLLTITGTGVVQVKATALGNDNYFPADTIRSFTIHKGLQEINFEAVATKTFGDVAFALRAQAESGLPVQFALVSGPATLQDSMVTITGAGTITVRAIQAGNENYEADSAEQVITVLKAAQTITFPVIAPKLKYETVTLNASSSTGLPITYSVPGGGGIITGNQIKLTSEGLITVKALQAGNENYDTATAEQQILVLGLGLIKDPIDIKIYPNPTRGPVTVKLDNKKDRTYVFSVFDKRGNRVAYVVIPQGQAANQVTLDLSVQRPDIYILHVTDGVDKTVRPIIKY
jgi:hypothetical protein